MKTHSLLNNVSYRKGGNIKCFNELQIPSNSSSNFYLSFFSRSKSLSKLCYLTACESISAARAHFHNYFLRVHLLVSANYRLESTRNLQRRVLCADCVRVPVSLFVTRKTRLLRWKNILFLVFSSFFFLLSVFYLFVYLSVLYLSVSCIYLFIFFVYYLFTTLKKKVYLFI